MLDRRSPHDLDVVTFLHTPIPVPGINFDSILDHDAIKDRFHIDSYFVELDAVTADDLVAQSAYWYSLWSHRRGGLWKGYLQVDLDPADDEKARQWLDQSSLEGGKP